MSEKKRKHRDRVSVKESEKENARQIMSKWERNTTRLQLLKVSKN